MVSGHGIYLLAIVSQSGGYKIPEDTCVSDYYVLTGVLPSDKYSFQDDKMRRIYYDVKLCIKLYLNNLWLYLMHSSISHFF